MSIRNLLLALAVLLPAPLAAQGITIPNTFVNGTAADATQVNANFTSLANNALNRTGGTMTGTLTTLLVQPTSNNASDIGTASLLYKTIYTRSSLVLGQAAGNYTLTWANPAAARAISFEDPGGTDILVYKAATQTLTNKTISTGSTYNAGAITSSGVFQLTGAIAHGIGGAAYGYTHLRLGDGSTTFTAPGTADAVYGILGQLKLQAGAGKDAYGLAWAPALVNASGTGALFAGAKFDAPTITISAGAVTTAATVSISGAPSGASNNYALNVVAGASQFGGTVASTGTITSSGMPGFSAYNSADDVTQANTATVQFDTEDYDVLGNFAANTFTAPVTGKYLFTAGVTTGTGSATQDRSAYLFVNAGGLGQLGYQGAVATGTLIQMTGSAIVALNATDTVVVKLGLSTGTCTVLGNASRQTFFTGRLLP